MCVFGESADVATLHVATASDVIHSSLIQHTSVRVASKLLCAAMPYKNQKIEVHRIFIFLIVFTSDLIVSSNYTAITIRHNRIYPDNVRLHCIIIA